MKKTIFLLVLSVFLFHFSSNSQDIIITTENDTIDCIIKNVNAESVEYQIWDGWNLINKSINKSDLKTYKQGFYQQTNQDKILLELNHSHYFITLSYDTVYCNVLKRNPYILVYSEKIEGKEVVSIKNRNEISEIVKIKRTKTVPSNAVEFSLQAGYGQRLGSTPSTYTEAEKQMASELKTGIYLGGAFRAYIGSNFALGANFSQYRSKAEGSLPFTLENEEIYYAHSKINLAINYISGEGVFTFYSKDKTATFSAFISLGLINYKETGDIEGVEIISKGRKAGFGIGGNINYFITPNFGLMLKVNAINGSLSKLDIIINNNVQTVELEEDEILSLGRIELGGGIVIRL